ncbi:MAG: hypothetical protein JSW46_11715 [Gemmatimonadota bacterium]|nr:MAG: hypothetical protein JSW46_11715 [Gemmatimonadota bacterium]
MEIGADTCVLEVEGRAEPWALPLASVETLEVRKWAMFRPLHILIGAGAGLLVGGIMAANIISEEAPFAEERATERLVFGPLIGGFVGAVIPGKVWKRVDLEEIRVQLRVRVAGAPSLSLSMSVAVQQGACRLAVGAGVGSVIVTDRWEEVPLHRLRVSMVPHRNASLRSGCRSPSDGDRERHTFLPPCRLSAR